MKLYVFALCWVATSIFFVRCEIRNDKYLDGIDVNGEETVDGEALMEELGQIKDNVVERALESNDGGTLVSNKTENVSNDSGIGRRELEDDDKDASQSDKIEDALDDLNIGGRVLRGNGGEALISNQTANIPSLDDLDIGGRALRENHGDESKKLSFGDKDRYVADKNDVLGEGFAGKVYKATDRTTGRQVAVKTELRNARRGTLLIESKNYEIIGRQRGIPQIFFAGRSQDGESQVLVMQLLRNSLADLQNKRRKQRFSPKTVYMIGIQLMYRIQLIHRKRLIHRDIKPENFGIDGTGRHIYIFDFGTSKKYINDQGRHIPEGQSTPFGSGTPRYMSAYAHSHLAQSRRDDLEAIGFMLMAFLRGNLPWDAVHDYKALAHKSQAVRMKQDLDFNEFCKGYARQMVDYFNYVRNELKFSTKPNYSYLRKLFRAALSDIGKNEDQKFDWPTEVKRRE